MLLGLWEYTKTSPWWFFRKLRFMLAHHLEDRAPAVTVPTLVLRGETDRVCPRGWVAEVTSLIPKARMVEITGRGHEAIIRSPEPVATLIREFICEVDHGTFTPQSG